jgi:hypothetical protein
MCQAGLTLNDAIRSGSQQALCDSAVHVAVVVRHLLGQRRSLCDCKKSGTCADQAISSVHKTLLYVGKPQLRLALSLALSRATGFISYRSRHCVAQIGGGLPFALLTMCGLTLV